jgi:hypothetical protein
MPDGLAVSMSEARMAQFSAPSSCPANKAFLGVKACGRIERSTMLVSSSMRPFGTSRDVAIAYPE